MSFCAFAGRDAMFGITPVENMFILEYMPGATGDFVRVYLYGLMLCHHPEMDEGIDGMARALRIDADTILSAYRYWEREGLVSRLTDNPPTYEYLALSSMNRASEPLDEVYKYKNFNRELQNALPGILLDSHEYRIANEWMDVLSLPEDVILYMVRAEAAKRGGKLPAPRTLFKHLDETATRWANEGLYSIEQAEDYVAKSGAAAGYAKAVIKQFGQSRPATKDEIALCEKWMTEWNLSLDDVISACAETVKGTVPSFAYLDKILLSKVSGESSKDDAREKIKVLLSHLGTAARPTQAHLSAYNQFIEAGFDFPAIEQAAILCGENNRRTFEDIQRKLDQWKKMGVTTLAEIEEERRIQKQFTDITLSIFEKCGIDRKVVKSDISQVRIWTALIDLDAVLYAAECAYGTDAPMKYINKLIVSWSAKGIKTLDAAQKEYALHKAETAQTQKAESPKAPAYQQRSVTDDEFESGFYVDVMNRKRADT
ncbi:MAG: DnaD domain protein [Clostridia bacterium]|nr:DnaD domain protein [Clostridia bacterium]